MTQIRRCLCGIVLAVAMIVTMIPTTALAAGSGPFTDVKAGDWCFDAVQYVYENGLMNGTSSTQFSPNRVTSRGMIVTILHRLDGTPAAGGFYRFEDVAAGSYCEDAVAWGAENGIVGGYGNGKFGPGSPITREQLAAILYRYVGYKGLSAEAAEDNLAGFPDVARVSGYAVSALNWAVGAGLINGTADGTLNPQGSATRAQVAVILYRFCVNILGIRDTEHTVTFDLNYKNADIYKTVEVLDGKTVREPDDPVRRGYTFRGWYTAPTGGHKFDFDTAITGDLTLYARWAGSGSGGSGGSSSGSTYYGVTIGASENGGVTTGVNSLISGTVILADGPQLKVKNTGTVIATATPDPGYRFVKWQINGTDLPDGGTYTVNGSITIKAVFAPITYTVTITPRAGGAVTPTTVTAPYGAAITQSGNTLTVGDQTVTATPDAGYTFTGWTVGASTVTGNMTVTANFAPIPEEPQTVTITISPEGSGTVAPGTVTIPAGATVTGDDENGKLLVNGTEAAAATPADGYQFAGWTITADGDGKYTITATFTQIPEETYTVTIAVAPADSGTVDQTSIAGVPSGAAVTVSGNTLTINGTTVTATAEDGYRFVNWTISGAEVTGGATVTGDTTITANFEEIPAEEVTVTFDANGGSDSAMADQTFTKGTPANLNACTLTAKKYYAFLGWNTAADGTGTAYADEAEFPADESTTLYAQWAVDVLRQAVDNSVTGVSGQTGALNTKMQQVANSAKLNDLMERAVRLATKLSDQTNTEKDDQLIQYVQNIDWTTAVLADGWITGTADAVENDAAVSATVGGKVVILAAAGVPYTALQNAESYDPEDILAATIALTQDVWNSVLLPTAENFKTISDTFTVTYTGTETITAKFNDVDGLYTKLQAYKSAITSGTLTQEQAKEIVQILKDHVEVPTGQRSVEKLLKLTYAVAQDMLEEAVNNDTVNARLTVEFDILDSCKYAGQYEDGTFKDTYTLDLTGNCGAQYKKEVYDALITAKQKVENCIDKIEAGGEVIYTDGDIISALLENYGKVKGGMDVYATVPVPAKVQNAYDKLLNNVIASVKTKLIGMVNGQINTVDITDEINAAIGRLPMDSIENELNAMLSEIGSDKTVSNLELSDFGLDVDAFAAAVKSDIQKWWNENQNGFVDDVLTGGPVYKDGVILSENLKKLSGYLGEGSATRQYLDGTVRTGVQTYAENLLKEEITKAVQTKVTGLNSKISDINSALASAKTAFETANHAIDTANVAIDQANQTLETNKNDILDYGASEDDFAAMKLEKINTLVKPDDLKWSVDSIQADNVDWDDWTAVSEIITTLSDKIDELDALLTSINGDDAGSLKSQAAVIKAQKEVVENKLSSNSYWDEDEWGQKPTIGDVTMTVPDLADEKAAVSDAKTALGKITGEGGVDGGIEAAKTAAGSKFDSVVTDETNGYLKPAALCGQVAKAIQDKLDTTEQYQAIKDLLPLTGEDGSLALENVTLDTIGTFKTAMNKDLDELAGDSAATLVNSLNQAASALAKMPESATVSVTVNDGAMFTDSTVTAAALAEALQGSDLDAIYDSLCGLLTEDAKALSVGDFAAADYQKVSVTVTGGKYDYPLNVYLKLTNI